MTILWYNSAQYNSMTLRRRLYNHTQVFLPWRKHSNNPKKIRISSLCWLFNWCLERSNPSGQKWLSPRKLDSLLPSLSLLPKEIPVTQRNPWVQKKYTQIGFSGAKTIPFRTIFLNLIDIQCNYSIIYTYCNVAKWNKSMISFLIKVWHM